MAQTNRRQGTQSRMTKPDRLAARVETQRLERMVEKAMKARAGSYMNVEIVKLLRQERARLRRVVRRKRWCRPIGAYNRGYNQALNEILQAMQERP